VAENTLQHDRVLDRGDEAQATAALARQDVNGEHAPEQVSPREVPARGRRGVRDLVGGHRQCCWCAVGAVLGDWCRLGACPPAGVGGEEAVIDTSASCEGRSAPSPYPPPLSPSAEIEDEVASGRRAPASSMAETRPHQATSTRRPGMRGKLRRSRLSTANPSETAVAPIIKS
jgi:hypothetical protein